MTRSLLRRTAFCAVGLVLSVLSLSSCRSSPSVAAYIGNGVISAEAVDKAVSTRLQDDAVQKAFGAKIGDFRRIVLQDMISGQVYDAAAKKYGVTVSGSEVDARLSSVLLAQGETADALYATQAQQGLTPADVREQVRRFIIGEKISAAAGLDAPLSDAALQQAYEADRSKSAQIELGIITVQDQTTADSVLAQLVADPSTYPALATTYVGAYTLPQIQPVAASDIPTQLSAGVAKTPAGQGFTVAVPEAQGIVVTFVAGITYQSFEDAKSSLESAASQEVQAALSKRLVSIQQSLHVKVNPRYGSLDSTGALSTDSRDVVKVLGSQAATTTG